MRRLFSRTAVPPGVLARADLRRGDKVLAHATAEDGTWLLGTRDALVLVAPEWGGTTTAPTRLVWEQIENAGWDRDAERLRVAEVGGPGRRRPVHSFSIAEPGLLLQLIRDRVTASVLLQRRVVVSGKRGLTVVARRPPRGEGDITWTYELDVDVDPSDPAVQEAAAQGLRIAQEELGAGQPPI